MSPNVAEVDFRILPPLWERWWFESLLAVLITSTVYAFYRYRVERLLELERVRARIAADLHDDIGSSLSGMAFLSEAVDWRHVSGSLCHGRRGGGDGPRAR